MELKYIAIRLLSVIMFCSVARLIYGNKLKTGASWIWLVFSVGFLTLSLWPGAIDLCTKLVKADSWIEVVFFFILISLLVINIHFSLVISNLTDKTKDLAQEVSFLNREIILNKDMITKIHTDVYEKDDNTNVDSYINN